ncbi:MAG: efflux RND transporter permease subunit [Gammaproteobacteria bacterium]|jgi:multidrug efflux pump subunit AcrB
MSLLRRFLDNHVLANLTFILILVMGVISYTKMPRAKDPEINFNWININIAFPGASAIDVERRITDPIENAIRRSIQDIRFISSTSRDGVSNILIRFDKLDISEFDKRVSDLRREVQNTYTNELPEEATDPFIFEVTSSNSLPSATVVITSKGDDENLRRQAHNIQKDLERIDGVDFVNPLALSDPEIHIAYKPTYLEGLGVTPVDLSDTIRSYFRDVSVGDLETDGATWIIRLEGTNAEPAVLSEFPITTANGVISLGEIADIYRTTRERSELAKYNGQPAVTMGIIKKGSTNVLDLLDSIQTYIDQHNKSAFRTGVEIFLVDDQTDSTRAAISLMQNNALIGLFLVLLITWIFLGTRIAILTSIGIPFTLAGVFIILFNSGSSLNNSVLLGVVIALGMIVDDVVVVVESIYYRLQEGYQGMDAAIEALREVFSPVTTSVMTTIAAFLPLMLLPGILGDFMRVIPIVVTLSLIISLVEAYWMLPAHMVAAKIDYKHKSRTQLKREAMTHRIRLTYTKILLKTLRFPKRSLMAVTTIFLFALITLLTGHIRFNFFESEASQLFYVNLEMAQGTSLKQTNDKLLELEKKALTRIKPEELRASVVYSGQMFTQTEPFFGDTIGQVMFSLNPVLDDGRTAAEIIKEVEDVISDVKGAENIYTFHVADGPPTTKAVQVKIRGDDFGTIEAAANQLMDFLNSNRVYRNIALDYRQGNPTLILRYNGEAIKRSGVNPVLVSRTIQSLVDGEIVTAFQDQGEEVKVRLLAEEGNWYDVDELLRQSVSLPGGKSILLGELVSAEYGFGQYNIRHYNFRRAITMEADIDEEQINTVEANNQIVQEWNRISHNYPSIDLDFAGQLDDIQESLDALWILFILGLGCIYLILGTQFRSYWQPLMIIISVPLAFTGVVLGLLVTGNPMSLYTLYGVVALAGISVNSAIVLISAANQRLEKGMTLSHAIVYSARRRVIPILITSFTTIAGLFSLAVGLAGESLIWGPVATAIVWGLAFSTVLTLIVIPFLYRTFMVYSYRVKKV